MHSLVTEHAAALVFFAVLIAYELVRRRVALLRPPLNAYLARGALAALYLSFIGLDPARWLDADRDALAGGAALAALMAVVRRVELAALLRGPVGMLLPAALLALTAAGVEELVFRGAFVLPALGSPTGTVLAVGGSSVAYVAWRALALRDRSRHALAATLGVALALAAVTALSRSLWPALLAHAAFVLARGRP